jgi:hypothetical protein
MKELEMEIKKLDALLKEISKVVERINGHEEVRIIDIQARTGKTPKVHVYHGLELIAEALDVGCTEKPVDVGDGYMQFETISDPTYFELDYEGKVEKEEK